MDSLTTHLIIILTTLISFFLLLFIFLFWHFRFRSRPRYPPLSGDDQIQPGFVPPPQNDGSLGSSGRSGRSRNSPGFEARMGNFNRSLNNRDGDGDGTVQEGNAMMSEFGGSSRNPRGRFNTAGSGGSSGSGSGGSAGGRSGRSEPTSNFAERVASPGPEGTRKFLGGWWGLDRGTGSGYNNQSQSSRRSVPLSSPRSHPQLPPIDDTEIPSSPPMSPRSGPMTSNNLRTGTVAREEVDGTEEEEVSLAATARESFDRGDIGNEDLMREVRRDGHGGMGRGTLGRVEPDGRIRRHDDEEWAMAG